MKRHVDLAVIGTGSAGASAAYAVRAAGWDVAIMDERPFGGTCALRGCDPKKVLVGAAEIVDWHQRMSRSGVSGQSRIDWADLMRFKNSFTDPVPAARESEFREAGIATYHGAASFLDGSTLRVGDDVIEARHIVVATGAAPAALNIPGAEHLTTSDQFLDLPSLPERVLFVGGGYIAFEFAHISARAGAKAVIVQRGDRVLSGFDETLVSELVDVTRAIGVEVRLRTEVIGIEHVNSVYRVRLRSRGNEQTIDCDLAVHAAGRKANIQGLDLDRGGVAYTDAGVLVNEYLQSQTNPVVYSGGDAAQTVGLPLTPVAGAEGDVIAHNLLDANRQTIDYSGLASIVYTIPALGMAGTTETQAGSRGLEFVVKEGDSTQWYSSRRVRARRSSYRILIENETERIIGAHVLGPHTEELLNVFGLAILERIPASKLRSALFAYPTGSSDIAYMLD